MPVLTRVAPFTKASAAVLNTWPDAVEQLCIDTYGAVSATARPRFRLVRTSSLSVTSSADTIVPWQSPVVDTDSVWDPGSPTIITIRTTGLWLLISSLRFSANTTGRRIGHFLLNGTSTTTNTIYNDVRNTIVTTGAAVVGMATFHLFTVGDLVRVNALQDSGSTLSLETAFGGTTVSGVWLGP